mmetsp:Transcript_19665/g.42155  ORF Transcript_19665/g.42155 Transcript_19665/m.42155 type:complete len:235 (-) Transcript_19665:750-1454(-)
MLLEGLVFQEESRRGRRYRVRARGGDQILGVARGHVDISRYLGILRHVVQDDLHAGDAAREVRPGDGHDPFRRRQRRPADHHLVLLRRELDVRHLRPLLQGLDVRAAASDDHPAAGRRDEQPHDERGAGVPFRGTPARAFRFRRDRRSGGELLEGLEFVELRQHHFRREGRVGLRSLDQTDAVARARIVIAALAQLDPSPGLRLEVGYGAARASDDQSRCAVRHEHLQGDVHLI